MGGAGGRLRTTGEGETTRGGRLARRGAPTRRRFCGEMAHGGGDGLTDEDEPRACRRCGGGQAPLCLRRAAAEVLQLLSPLLRRCERRVVQHDSSKGGLRRWRGHPTKAVRAFCLWHFGDPACQHIPPARGRLWTTRALARGVVDLRCCCFAFAGAWRAHRPRMPRHSAGGGSGPPPVASVLATRSVAGGPVSWGSAAVRVGPRTTGSPEHGQPSAEVVQHACPSEVGALPHMLGGRGSRSPETKDIMHITPTAEVPDHSICTDGLLPYQGRRNDDKEMQPTGGGGESGVATGCHVHIPPLLRMGRCTRRVARCTCFTVRERY